MKICILFCFCFFLSFGQNKDKQADSLKLVLNSKKINYKQQVVILDKLAEYYNKNYDFKQANVFNNKIYLISKNDNYRLALGYFFKNKSHSMLLSSDFNKALLFAKKAQFYFNLTKQYNNFLLSVYDSCFLLGRLGRSNEAEKLAYKTVKEYQNKPNTDGIAELYYFISTLYEKNKPKTSIVFLNKALAIYRKNHNENGIAKCNYQFSGIYFSNEMYKKSIFYLDKFFKPNSLTLNCVVDFENNIYYAYVLNYIELNDFKNALIYAEKFKLLVYQHKMHSYYDLANSLLAEIYAKQKKYKLALLYVNKINQNKLNDEDKFELNLIQARIYSGFQKYAKSLYFSHLNYQSFPEDLDNLKFLAQTYSTLGNFEKAYKYQNKYDILHDSLEEKKRVNTMSDYEAFYELKDMEYELNKNKLAVIKKENKILQQERYLVISLVISISLFLIFVLLGYSYQIKRKTNRLLYSKNEELKQLNQIIAASLKEKEILLKEIHHRVKNNLQLVMSLLNIQAQDSQHTSIEDFLEKGQLRIVTMSLIHQNLYLSENFTNIDFQIYLESLVENIQHTFNGNNVTSVINTNGNTFNLDTAIPLGLIINEIVCNALKHAFPDNMKGQIQISIQKKEPDLFELQIGDNGIGIQQTKKSNSIGLELVSLLVLQLRGKMHKINKRGTNYSIEFKQSTSY